MGQLQEITLIRQEGRQAGYL